MKAMGVGADASDRGVVGFGDAVREAQTTDRLSSAGLSRPTTESPSPMASLWSRSPTTPTDRIGISHLEVTSNKEATSSSDSPMMTSGSFEPNTCRRPAMGLAASAGPSAYSAERHGFSRWRTSKAQVRRAQSTSDDCDLDHLSDEASFGVESRTACMSRIARSVPEMVPVTLERPTRAR